jgi:hypothetical protein
MIAKNAAAFARAVTEHRSSKSKRAALAEGNPKEKIIVAVILGPRVSNCGGGRVIVGGKLVRVPPRSPALQKLAAAAAALEQIDGLQDVAALRTAAERTLESAAEELTR